MNKEEFLIELKKFLKEKRTANINYVDLDYDKLSKTIADKLVEGIIVKNWPTSLKIEKPDWYLEPKEVKIPKFPESVKVSNLDEIPKPDMPKIPEFPKEMGIREPNWIGKILKALKMDNITLDMLEGLRRILQEHRQPDNAIAVKLVTIGDHFYNAMMSAVSGGGYEVVGIKDSNGVRITPAKHLSINKAIEDLTTDINAAAYSKVTAHATDYRFSGIYLQFSTAESKTITLSITNGAISIPLWVKTADTGLSRVFVPDKSWELPADWELKVEITQTGGVCVADILLITINN